METIELQLKLDGLNVRIVDEISHILDLQKEDIQAVVEKAVDDFDFKKFVTTTTHKVLKDSIQHQIGHWARMELRSVIADAIKETLTIEIGKGKNQNKVRLGK